MVKPFNFSRLPVIYFGPGKISVLPEIISAAGKSVLLVTGKKSFIGTKEYQHLIRTLTIAGIEYFNIIIEREPSPSDIDDAINQTSGRSFDIVAAIGGGSVMDAGKAISAMLYKNESVKNFLEGVGRKEHPGTKVPFVAVPTTAGTGSEATKNAVLSEVNEDGFKKSLRHDNLVPDIAIVDPMLTMNCPISIITAGGMDCFTQLTEAFLSDKANEFTDGYAIAGLKAVKESLRESFLDPTNIEARSGMSFAALTSGICLANAGLGVVHGFASSIGGLFNIAHGVVCGTLMAPSNEINVRELRKNKKNKPALQKYASLGRLFLNEKGKSNDYYIDGFIQYLYQLTIDFQLPGLRTLGITEKDLDRICDKTDNKNNPVSLTRADLKEILSGKLY
jgi:alcohol dehydrogenase class IV